MAFIIDSIIKTVNTVLDRVIPDKNARERAKMEFELFTATKEFDLLKSQLEINMQEAGHRSVFVAGWRPFLGWTCGLAFSYNYVLYPIIQTIAAATGSDVTLWPVFDLTQMMPVLLGMLGLAGFRTYEKSKGVSK